MRARYLLRFDDVCPTMNWAVWDRIESLLVDAGVRPIVAIVPDNRDEGLVVGDPNPRFWERARAWRARGWAIAMHGYQHRSVTRERGLIGINARSEFAGLPLEAQREKIRRALAILEREGLRPDAWAAPNHSFDASTVTALGEAGVTLVSDGLVPFPFRDRGGVTWVPHQLWRFRPMPFGVWTVGCHHNSWTERQLSAFARDLRRYRDRVTDLPSIVRDHGTRPQRPWDVAVARTYLGMILLKRHARKARLLRVPGDAY